MGKSLRNNPSRLKERGGGKGKKLTFFKFSQYIEIAIRFLPIGFYLFALKIQSLIRLRPRKLLRFEVSIVDHCNLNCVGCDHFSPLAKENYIKVNELEKDFARLSELTKGKIETLHLMGGEPLLHPEIDKIIKISRKYFPIGDIEVVTNGILLSKMNKSFWEMCAINKIIISLTRYPIKLDMDKIAELVKKYNVNFQYYNVGKKKMYKRPLDLLGRQNIGENFKICHVSNYCIQLQNGKLYTCILVPYIKFFNDYFGQNLKIDEKDGIDIYKVDNMNEIFKFLIKPISSCRYCNLKAIERGLEWKVSEKDINEWI